MAIAKRMIRTRREGIGRGGIGTPSRIAAIGGTRVARRAGKKPAAHGHDDADEQRDDHRARLEDRAVVRQVGSEGLEQPVQRRREPDPDGQADGRAEDPKQQPFDDDRAHDLPAGGAERPQQTELPRALGDGDREGVEDDEGPDDDRHVGEDQEEGPQEAELFFEFLCLVGGFLGAGAHDERVRAARRGRARRAFPGRPPASRRR